MAGDVVQVIILRKGFEKRDDSDARYFVYPQKAAEFAMSLAGEKPTLEERSRLEAICRDLLDKVGI